MNIALDRRTAQKPFVWTYTNLHTYDDVCPHQMYRRYIKRDVPFVSTPAAEFGNKVHTAFELRVGGGKVLPDDMRQWEHFATPFDPFGSETCHVEMKLAVTVDGKPCDYFASDVAGRGKADVVVKDETVAFISDWKTGNSRYEDPFELEIHGLMLKARFPSLQKVYGTYVWLKENRASQMYDLSDFNATWARINNIVEAIKDDMADGEFEKRKGPLCGWCDCIDCEFNTKGK